MTTTDPSVDVIVDAAAGVRPSVEPEGGPDALMRRLLRLPTIEEWRITSKERENERSKRTAAERAFSTSMLISAVRCLLTYIVLPWILPIVGVAKGVSAEIGIPISAVAIVFNLLSIRRLWAANHRWRWQCTVIGSGIIVLLIILIVLDVQSLMG